MGRTQHTYRQRLLKIRDQMLTKVKNKTLRKQYRELWVYAHQLSAPASAFPWPDTHAMATYSMLLKLMIRISNLEEKLNKLEKTENYDTQVS